MAESARVFRMSLARKLSLLTGAMIAICLLIVLGVAYEVLTASAMTGASESIGRATRQLASVAETSIRQLRMRYDSLTHETAIRSAVTNAGGPSASAVRSGSSDSVVQRAERALARLTTAADSGLPVELWTADGRRVAFVGSADPLVPESPAPGRPLGAPRVPHAGIEDIAANDSLQLGRLYATAGRVYFWIVQPIVEQGKAIGYIAHQRRIATNPQADRSVRALAGEGVSMYYRNADGSVWSSVGGSPASPSRRLPNDSTLAARSGGERMIIAEAPVNGTQLVVTMESRVRDVLAAPRKTLRQLLVVGILLLIAGMGAALMIGRGIARPIGAIAYGAEAIARGEYDTRVDRSSTTEIERLADSFNHMANEVETTQRALKQKTVDAQSANRAKSDFLATVSHELRTPLNAIAGYTELLEMGLRGPLNDAQRKDLARIRSSGQHLLGLISGVLDLNRIERGQVTYSLAPIAVEPFLTDLDALVSPQATAKSLTLDYRSSDSSLTLLADREKLRQIILNLLSNAIRFTPSGGRITLTSSAVGEMEVEICIEDTGPGIPEARRAQVFEPFVQLDRSLTQPQEGLGLGLAISRDLARGMHGELKLSASRTGGASFHLTLPRGLSTAPAEVTTSGELHAQPTGRPV